MESFNFRSVKFCIPQELKRFFSVRGRCVFGRFFLFLLSFLLIAIIVGWLVGSCQPISEKFPFEYTVRSTVTERERGYSRRLAGEVERAQPPSYYYFKLFVINEEENFE